MVLNEQNGVWDYNSCRERCKETNGCNYIGIWTGGKVCVGWDICDSCQSSNHKNEVYKVESGNKNQDT